MDEKVRRTPSELIHMIRCQLAGKYAKVPITIERAGTSWIAVIHVL